MIEIVREPNGPVTIRIVDEDLEDIKEILTSLFKEGAFAQTRIHALSARFGELEDSISQLVGINEKLAETLRLRGEERRPHLPARGTKYYERLWTLCGKYLDGSFTSDEVPEKERHILSILKNEYEVLEVAKKKGRRNFYRIKSEIARTLIKDRGHWFSISIDPSSRADVDPIVGEEIERGEFLLDVAEGDSGPIYEFFFPDPERGRAFEQRLLASP